MTARTAANPDGHWPRPWKICRRSSAPSRGSRRRCFPRWRRSKGSRGAARAVACWRAGELDEAWRHVVKLLKDRKGARAEVQVLAARIKQAKGDNAGAAKLLRAVLSGPKKTTAWREQAEALLAQVKAAKTSR